MRIRRDPGGPVDLALARQVAVREGATAVVGGVINLAAGGGLVLYARILSADDGEVLASARETAGDSADVVAAIDRLSEKLRERIGESLKLLRNEEPLPSVTTSSLQALRRYSRGVRAYVEGDHARSKILLEEAVRLDTAFAMAYVALGITLYPRDKYARSRAALQKGLELAARLTDRERYHSIALYNILLEGKGDTRRH